MSENTGAGSLIFETTTMRPEEELLLRCARSLRDHENATLVRRLLERKIDWEYLLQLARGHGMMPLLFWHLDSACPEAVPNDVYEQLRDYFQFNNLRNLFLTGELLKILDALESSGVSVVPYKGPALTAFAYGNLALREFVDLDILVRRRDLPKASETLSSLGYRQRERLTRAQEAAFIHSDCEYHFMPEENGTDLVELHWQFTPRFFSFLLDPECLWGRLEQTSLGGGTVLALSREDLLLVLCAHGCAEFWRQLKLICDVSELIQAHEAIDWERLMERAGKQGSERMLLLGLFLANDLLGAPLPNTVLQKVRHDRAVESLGEQVYGWLFRGVSYPRGFSENSEDNTFSSFHVEIRERPRDKLRYCFRVAATPNTADWTVLPLPKLLWPLYYLIRPVRLAGKYSKRSFERFT